MIQAFAISILLTLRSAQSQQNFALKSFDSWCGAGTLDDGSPLYCDEVLDGASAVGNDRYKFLRATKEKFLTIEFPSIQTIRYVRLMQDFPAESKNVKQFHVGVAGGESYTVTLPDTPLDGYYWHQVELTPVSTQFVDIRFDEVFQNVNFTINEVEIYNEEPSFGQYSSFCNHPVMPSPLPTTTTVTTTTTSSNANPTTTINGIFLGTTLSTNIDNAIAPTNELPNSPSVTDGNNNIATVSPCKLEGEGKSTVVYLGLAIAGWVSLACSVVANGVLIYIVLKHKRCSTDYEQSKPKTRETAIESTYETITVDDRVQQNLADSVGPTVDGREHESGHEASVRRLADTAISDYDANGVEQARGSPYEYVSSTYEHESYLEPVSIHR